jgi:hypothetical protein
MGMDLVPSNLVPGRFPAIPCVADVRLSLGTGGLFWILGLARALPVWLVQAHWAIVDDPAFYLRQDALVRWLTGAPPDLAAESCRGTVIGSCESWRLARRDWCLDTHPNLYWPAERSLEAVLPKDGRRGLADLCDALATGLDRRRGRSPETVDALADCGRDTLALAAALVGARPLVLAALAPDEAAPAAARSLEEAGVPCRRLESGGQTHSFDAALAPALLEAGVAAALASGALRLAGLQVVAPRAHLPSPADGAEGDDDRLAWNEAERGDEARLWDDAVAIFWEVRCAI